MALNSTKIRKEEFKMEKDFIISALEASLSINSARVVMIIMQKINTTSLHLVEVTMEWPFLLYFKIRTTNLEVVEVEYREKRPD
jgi:hypothetical protein